jgi:hypothetical protein
MTPVGTPVGTPVSRVTKPQRAGVVPIGLLVNHNRLGLGLGLHEHPPKGEREGDDRDD